jgi:two-component system chemotaxis response regulator CheB
MSSTRHDGRFDLVVVVGSQGAVPVAERLLGALDPGFPAAVVYVQHRPASAGSLLAELLSRRLSVPVRTAGDGDAVRPGTVHLAPAGAQTLVSGGRFRLVDGRCTGDPLLVSAARDYGARTVGVVLSGRLGDGAAGLIAVKGAGGRALVQDPGTAEQASMPSAALATGCYDFALPPRGLAAALVALVAAPGAADLLAVRRHPLTVPSLTA